MSTSTDAQSTEYAPVAHSAVARYGLAVGLAVAAVLGSRGLTEITDVPSYVLPVTAVAISVWYGGVGSGLVSIAVGWALAPWLFETDRNFLDGDAYRWVTALACALAVVWVSQVMRTRQARAATAVVAAEEATRNMEALEQEATRRGLETRRLLDATAALASAATPAEVTGAILHEGLQSLGAVAGVVARTTEAGGLEILETRGYEQATVAPWQQIPPDAPVPLAEAVRDERLIAITDPDELALRYPSIPQDRIEPTRSWLAAPLSAGGSVIGAAGFSFADARAFTQAELEFAEALASQSGQALERALLLAAEYSARTRAEDLVVLTSAFGQAMSLSELGSVIANQALSPDGVDLAGVYVADDGGTLELVAATGRGLGPSDRGLRRLALADDSLPAAVARSGEAVWLEPADGRQPHVDDELWEAAGARYVGAVPLVVGRAVLGALVVGSATTPIGTEARERVLFVARQAAQPLERAWLMEREQAARVTAELASTRTRRLQSMTQALAAVATPREVAEIVLHEALAAGKAEAGFLVALEDGRDGPELLARTGIETESPAQDLVGALVEAGDAGSLLVIDGESSDPRASAARKALIDAGLEAAVCVPLAVGGQVLGSLVVCLAPGRTIAQEDTELLLTLARIGAQALERSRLFEQELRLRRRSERIQSMTASLSGSLTQRDVAEVVVEALVHTIGADGAAVSVVIDDRRIQKKLAWRGYDDELHESWLEIPLEAATPGNLALDNRAMVFCESREALRSDFPDAIPRMRTTDHESFLFVPLVVGGLPNGLVTMSWSDPVVVSAEDRKFIGSLASQAAQALDRALRFESERTIAETLQQSVLPVSLPRIENVQLAARYLSGTEEVDVGGDWFDAIQLPNGRLGLVVGDVVGKGVQAASTMAQLRNALRAFALDHMRPSSTISRLNRLTEDMSEAVFATVVYAVIDHETHVCRFTSAGHAPPLVVFPDGHAEFIEGGRGLPLGTGSAVSYRQQAIELPVGSMVILYTDGLVERRSQPIDHGLERLRQAAEEAPGDPERLVEHVLEALVGDEGRGDDIAMLAARLLTVAPNPLELRLPRRPRSLDLVRDAVRVWLQRAPVTQSEAHEIVLATWEACANALEHPTNGDNGSLLVRTELNRSSVSVTVSDPGTWLPERDRPDRGLGLRLIRSLMSSVDVRVTGDGTFVRLEKELAGEVLQR